MDKDLLNELLLIGIPVIAAAAALAVAWLRAKAREISRKAEEKEIKYNLDLLDKIVFEVAESLNVTLVHELEKAHTDGSLSCEELEKVKQEALRHIYSVLDESIITMLKKVTNDLDCFICSKIESILHELKEYDKEKND